MCFKQYHPKVGTNNSTRTMFRQIINVNNKYIVYVIVIILIHSISNRLGVYIIGALFIIISYVVYIISQLNIETKRKQKKYIYKELVK